MPMLRSLVAVFGLLAATAGPLAAPALWKVSDADSAIWLFGSVHILRSDVDWRTARLDKIASKADRIYFEADVSAEAQAQIIAETIALGFNTDGVLLSEQIGPDLTARVRDAANEYGIPMPSLLTMKPWLAATTLSSGPLMQSGYDPIHGVESVLAEDLPADRKGFLETGQEQLAFLAGGSLDEQIMMLEATLNSLPGADGDLDAMIEAWVHGDPEELGAIFTSQMDGFDASTLYRIIDVRNGNWTEKIATMLAQNEEALLVVGAAHLAGDSSVVRLLEARGFLSERVQ